jgi:hypothetical protein
MADQDSIVQLALFPDLYPPPKSPGKPGQLHTYWLHPEALPAWVSASPTLQRYLALVGPLHWAHLPERNLHRHWGQAVIPYTALIAAELLKLNEGLPSTGALHRYLHEHPGFIWLFGFPRVPAPETPLGFNARASLPTLRHVNRLFRQMPNAVLQVLLADSVQLILAALRDLGVDTLECVSLDTKHILAWVKENNPKAYVSERFNKTKQPPGDPDCRLGCKRRRNQAPPPTPTRQAVPAKTLAVGEYYWGYGSGVVVAKIAERAEFVLAELTQPFDQGDVTYFFPLLQQVEQRLGYRPRLGTFDAAFDAWYVYAYFYRENDPAAFAAVPFAEKGGYSVTGRRFSSDGLPLCAAGFPMPLLFTYTDRTTCLLEHERGKYVCPLRDRPRRPCACPQRHPTWRKGGCTVLMPTSIGARLRYQLDRESDAYRAAYRQRTAVERINAQAVALGIERPHWRNGHAIANQNTLIYLLINLRCLQRLRAGQVNSE